MKQLTSHINIAITTAQQSGNTELPTILQDALQYATDYQHEGNTLQELCNLMILHVYHKTLDQKQ